MTGHAAGGGPPGRGGNAEPEPRPDMERDDATEPLSASPPTVRLDHEDATAALGPEATGRGRRAAAAGAPPAAADGELLLGRYRLGRRLGAGGFGVVWLARDEKLEREVAVKVISREADPATPVRAEREARAAARLNHPGIVALYELATDEGAVYLVSELVRGRTMAELERGGALSDQDVARIGVALSEALAHAHTRGVIHRDVKPQNVIVAAEPAAGAGFAKLTDFGVAHLAGGDPLTRTGDVVGTLAYMAPEQAEGETVGEAADVYSLALTLYEGWTGTNPVRGATPAATARRLGTRLPPLRSARRDLPAALGHVIDEALDPDPGRRPPLEVLRDVLDEAAEGMSDEGGLVEPGTLERVGLLRRGRRDEDARPLPGQGLGLADAPPVAAGRALARLPARLLAGAAAGALALAALLAAGEAPPVSPFAVAGVAAVAVGLLPRLAWLGTAAVLLAWVGSPRVGLDGAALLAAAALVPIPLLLPRAGALWSLPALAPLLATTGLGPAFLGLAGLASTLPRRAGLGAAGFGCVAVAELLAGETLLFGRPDAAPGAGGLPTSASSAADALSTLVTTPVLAPAVVWAAAAAVLPLAVRGRSLALDLGRGVVWAAGLAAAHAALADVLGGAAARSEARGLLIGVALALTAAVAAAAVRASPPAGNPRDLP